MANFCFQITVSLPFPPETNVLASPTAKKEID